MEVSELIGGGFVLGILGIGATIGMFFIKQLADIKKQLADLCERMAREETKSKIYHESHELEDK